MLQLQERMSKRHEAVGRRLHNWQGSKYIYLGVMLLSWYYGYYLFMNMWWPLQHVGQEAE